MKKLTLILTILLIAAGCNTSPNKSDTTKNIDSNQTYNDSNYNFSFTYPMGYHVDNNTDAKLHGIVLLEDKNNNTIVRINATTTSDGLINADWHLKYTIKQDMGSITPVKLTVNGQNAYKAEGIYQGPSDFATTYEKFYTFDSIDGKTNLEISAFGDSKEKFPNSIFDLVTSSIHFAK